MAPIQRVLFVCPTIRVYPIPPGTGVTGHKAKAWNVDDEKSCIFTGRLRVLESTEYLDEEEEEAKVTIDIAVETNEGELFANCPYDVPAAVEPVTDSSRFFAIRVVHGRQKATLGIGFEDRTEAFDFGVCLQEARRQNGIGQPPAKKDPVVTASKDKDYSLKEGETISITIGNKGRRRAPPPSTSKPEANESNFPIPFLPPPPSADDVRKRQSMQEEDLKMGFDDDPFGDFV